MTNREWLANMSNSRLACFLSENEQCDYCQLCDYKGVALGYPYCDAEIEKWLEAEHTENDEDSE